ncbi:hypothetical protein LTR95_004760 [Oleoguttula sp. CCFEE 5521]
MDTPSPPRPSSRNPTLTPAKLALLRAISQAARERQAFPEDDYSSNGDLDVSLEKFEPLLQFLVRQNPTTSFKRKAGDADALAQTKRWPPGRLKGPKPDWLYFGRRKWHLVLLEPAKAVQAGQEAGQRDAEVRGLWTLFELTRYRKWMTYLMI